MRNLGHTSPDIAHAEVASAQQPELTNLGSGSRAFYESCLNRGMTLREIAAETGVDYTTAWRRAKRYGLEFPHANQKHGDPRSVPMVTLYRASYTLEQIGEQYGITRERVRQILTKYHGITAKDGGAHAAATRHREERKRDKDAACFRKNGCSYAQLRELRRIGREMEAAGLGRERTPVGAYNTQRCNARRRGISWELKLWEWWSIWQESGHWAQRGRGQGYVMSRYNDQGPYAAGNVFICHATENSSNTKNKKSGLPIGVSLVVKGKYLAYVAYRATGGRQKYLGSFPTPELAHAAYLAASSSEAA